MARKKDFGVSTPYKRKLMSKMTRDNKLVASTNIGNCVSYGGDFTKVFVKHWTVTVATSL